MSEVKFEQGVSAEDITTMAEMMRDDEKADFRAAFGDVHDGLTACCSTANVELQTARIDGELIAIFGLTVGWLNEYSAHPWMALSRSAIKHPRAVVRASRAVVLSWAQHYQLLCNFIPTFDEDGIKFLRAIGFQFLDEVVEEGEITRMPFYMVGGKA